MYKEFVPDFRFSFVNTILHSILAVYLYICSSTKNVLWNNKASDWINEGVKNISMKKEFINRKILIICAMTTSSEIDSWYYKYIYIYIVYNCFTVVQ